MMETWEEAARRHRAGEVVEASRVYRRVLETQPDNAQVLHLLGVAEFQMGRPADAEPLVRRAIAVLGDDARFHNTLANILVATGRPEEAERCLARAVALAPQAPDLAVNHAAVLTDLGRPAEAEAVCLALLARVPGHPGALAQLGAARIQLGRYREAAETFGHGVALGHDAVTFNVNRASALELANDLPGAEAAVEAALAAAAPAVPGPVMLMRGKLRFRAGRLEEALADLALAEPALTADRDRAELLSVRGLACDKLKRWGDAFAAFTAGNRLRAALPKSRVHDGDRFLARCAERLAQVRRLPPAAPSSPAAVADPRDAPIFFVGFPRSGTTLMETVLAAHPGVTTTSERSPLNAVAARLGGRDPLLLGAAELPALRALFHAETERVVGPLGGRRLVDKLPLNILDLGLAQALFPAGRVLMALRDPRDCVLSCFMQGFQPNDAMVNFLDLERAARTYAAVMEIWLAERRALRLPWMEYRYEDLASDFDPTVRAVLDFTGLGWHDDLARYADKARGRDINTPSYREVLRPVDRRAVGRWRPYAEALAPVLPVLAPFAAAFGYEAA
ncbi:sulfotransferase [Novispirillum sp. DQ9]|uniref:tetratricopeptide repeat-containing sulfotransferase family protein n=1 Tax=Novispirillum sp. DQ9 TaxID=3398612 RepID=UPI003C7B15B7